MLALAWAVQAQTVLVNENFDSYSAGTFLADAAGAPWSTWSNNPGGADDAVISDEQAASAPNSGAWTATSTNGGPGDVVLNLGNQTAGVWNISFKMYIPSGFGGYFNILHVLQGNSSKWAVEVTFPANGDVNIMLQNVTTTYGSYPHDAWFPVHITVDMNAVQASLEVNNTAVHTWPFNWNAGDANAGLNQLAAMDFFAYAGEADLAKYYIDDVVVEGTTVGVSEMAVANLGFYPNPAKDVLHITAASGASAWCLRDATGRTVMEGDVAKQQGDPALDLSGLIPGIYLLDLVRHGRHALHKVVKQ